MSSSIFLSSLQSIGNAISLAAAGSYLAHLGIVTKENKKMLAEVSKNLTIPCLLFTKMLACNQDWSTEPCPDVFNSVRQAWYLMLYPIWVVATGILVGLLMCYLSGSPKRIYKTVIAATAFGNSTGLPITLLTVIHLSFDKSTGACVAFR